jgi:hypothetical protein
MIASRKRWAAQEDHPRSYKHHRNSLYSRSDPHGFRDSESHPISLARPRALIVLRERRAHRTLLGLRPPLMKQDLAIARQHPRLQFASDFKALVIVFSDESRLVLGDDRRWRQRSYGRQNLQSRCPFRDAAAG